MYFLEKSTIAIDHRTSSRWSKNNIRYYASEHIISCRILLVQSRVEIAIHVNFKTTAEDRRNSWWIHVTLWHAIKFIVFSACECFGHTTQCMYDEDVARNKRSLDIHGNYDGGGVCQNCMVSQLHKIPHCNTNIIVH